MPTPPAKLDTRSLTRARRALCRADTRLGELIRRVGPCRLAVTGRPYEALLSSVVHQQLAGSAARAIEARVKAAFGGHFPQPGPLRAAAHDELRALGLSHQKADTLQRIAEAFDEGRLCPGRMRRRSDEGVIEDLTELKGIGEWTAQMILIFSLGRPDVLPTGDYGVQKGACVVYGLDDLPRPAELRELADCWRPYRSVASWYLWRAADDAGRGPVGAKAKAKVEARAKVRAEVKAKVRA